MNTFCHTVSEGLRLQDLRYYGTQCIKQSHNSYIFCLIRLTEQQAQLHVITNNRTKCEHILSYGCKRSCVAQCIKYQQSKSHNSYTFCLIELAECTFFNNVRVKFLPRNICNNPNVLKSKELIFLHLLAQRNFAKLLLTPFNTCTCA